MEAIIINPKVEVECQHCNTSHQIEIEDSVTATQFPDALCDALAEYGWSDDDECPHCYVEQKNGDEYADLDANETRCHPDY